MSKLAGPGRSEIDAANPFSGATVGLGSQAEENLMRLSALLRPANAFAALLANGARSVSRRIDGLLRRQAQAELLRFQQELTLAVDMAASRLPGVADDPDVEFALTDLGPARVEAAQRYLAPCDERSYAAVISFLRETADGTKYDIEHAASPEDVGDAALRGFDALHGFLLAEELVHPAYRQYLAGIPRVSQAFPEPRRSVQWHPRQRPRRRQASVQRFSRDNPKHRVAVS